MARRNNKEKKEKLEICVSLWKNTSKNDTIYYSGIDADGNRLVGFPNTKKKNEKEPDIRVYYQEDDD